jgi:hypothetical protein
VKRLIRKAKEKLTRKNVGWCVRTNVQSWVIQGATAGGLSVAGVAPLSALVTAKVAAYVVFAWQCTAAARGGRG